MEQPNPVQAMSTQGLIRFAAEEALHLRYQMSGMQAQLASLQADFRKLREERDAALARVAELESELAEAYGVIDRDRKPPTIAVQKTNDCQWEHVTHTDNTVEQRDPGDEHVIVEEPTDRHPRLGNLGVLANGHHGMWAGKRDG